MHIDGVSIKVIYMTVAEVCGGCRDDEMGNIYGTWWGSERDLLSVATGSHTDAIPLSGMYDGTLGVIGGIAAVAALRQAVRFVIMTSTGLESRQLPV